MNIVVIETDLPITHYGLRITYSNRLYRTRFGGFCYIASSAAVVFYDFSLRGLIIYYKDFRTNCGASAATNAFFLIKGDFHSLF